MQKTMKFMIFFDLRNAKSGSKSSLGFAIQDRTFSKFRSSEKPSYPVFRHALCPARMRTHWARYEESLIVSFETKTRLARSMKRPFNLVPTVFPIHFESPTRTLRPVFDDLTEIQRIVYDDRVLCR